MITGLGNTFIQPNTATPPTVFPPFPANAAENGLSVDPVSGAIVLGQDIGAVGDPAQLSSNREIPFNLFSLAFGTAGNRLALFDHFGRQVQLGDVDLNNNGTVFFLDDVIQRVQVFDNIDVYLDIDPVSQVYDFGNVTNGGNRYRMRIDDSLPRWDIGDFQNVQNLLSNNPGAGIGLSFFDSNGNNPFLLPDPSFGGVAFISSPDFSTQLALSDAGSGSTASLGDVGTLGNGMTLFVNDLARLVDVSDNLGLYLHLDPGTGSFDFGDVTTSVNGTFLSIRDSIQFASITSNSNNYLTIDAGTSEFTMGDIPNNSFARIRTVEAFVNIQNAQALYLSQGLYMLGDITPAGNGNRLLISDAVNEFDFNNSGTNAAIRMNGVLGFTGTVAPPLTITVSGGIVTNVA